MVFFTCEFVFLSRPETDLVIYCWLALNTKEMEICHDELIIHFFYVRVFFCFFCAVMYKIIDAVQV